MKDKMKWIYLIVGTLILLCLGLLYAWSIFRKPLTELYTGWSLSQISMTFTISIICFCIGGLVGGKLVLKLSPKIVLLISGALLFIGFFGVSCLDPAKPELSLTLMYLFYGVCAGTGVGIGYNTIISTVTKWFPENQGFASGTLLMGFGIGGIALGSLINVIIESNGLFFTFRFLGVLILGVMLLGALLIKRPETVAKVASTGEIKSYKPGEMLKTGTFWIFVFWLITINTIGLIVINSAASIALAFGAPAVLGLMISVFNGIGRTLWGASYDGKGKSFTLGAITLVAIMAGIILFVGGTMNVVYLILIGMVLVGAAYGGSPTMSSAFINNEFGPKNFPVNFSIANFSLVPAALIGPLVSSKLIEKSNGEYMTTFTMIIGLGIVGFITYVLLIRRLKR